MRPDESALMSFGDHLDELRRRVLLAIVAPLPLAVVIFFFGEQVRTFMCRPLIDALRANHLPVQLLQLSPVETVLLDFKLAVILALVVAAPWILWQAWLFIAPGLYRHERRFVNFLLPASAALTVSGLALLQFVLLPLMLNVLVGFGVSNRGTGLPPPRPIPAPTTASSDGTVAAEPTPHGLIPVLGEHPATYRPGDAWIKTPENVLCVAVEQDGQLVILTSPFGRGTLVAQQYRLSEYIDFVLLTAAGIVIAFQMPLVILLLGWLDIVRLETLTKSRKYALLICAVVAAVATPSPDAVSMIITLAPLYALYEVGVLALRVLPAWRVLGLDPPVDDRARARPRSAPAQPVPAAGTVARGDGGTDAP